MMQKCFSVYDRKTGYFNVPYFAPTVEAGKRAFIEVIADHTTLPARYPEDFGLYLVGQFNDDKGEMVPVDKELVFEGVEAVVFLEVRRRQSGQMELIQSEEVKNA